MSVFCVSHCWCRSWPCFIVVAQFVSILLGMLSHGLQLRWFFILQQLRIIHCGCQTIRSVFRVLGMYSFAWNFYRTSTHIWAHLIHFFVLFLNGIPLPLFKHFTNIEIEYLKKWRMFWKWPCKRAIEILTFSYKNLTVTIFFCRPWLIDCKQINVITNFINKAC